MELELISAQIARLELKPTDTLVVRCRAHLSHALATRVRDKLRDAIKHENVLVIGDDMDLTVMDRGQTNGGG